MSDKTVIARIVNEDELVQAMVSRFLAWKLPGDFAPDAGVSFERPGNPNIWPTGTNLLDATQGGTDGAAHAGDRRLTPMARGGWRSQASQPEGRL